MSKDVLEIFYHNKNSFKKSGIHTQNCLMYNYELFHHPNSSSCDEEIISLLYKEYFKSTLNKKRWKKWANGKNEEFTETEMQTAQEKYIQHHS